MPAIHLDVGILITGGKNKRRRDRPMGSSHFLTKSLEKVKTEMSSHVLAYNMKGPLMKVLAA
jgi:hypothetical protein